MTTPVVLHIAPISSRRQASGPFHAISGLVAGLHQQGCQVALLTTGRATYDLAQPFPVFHHSDLGRPPDLSRCPPPFDTPDLVVFHSTYIPRQAYLAGQCRRRGIPYIITPHGGMTRGAQAIKPLKKRLGNLLFFSRMVRGAAAIHCLTVAEAADARAWGRPVFVVGNGVDLPPAASVATPAAKPGLRLLFVGRLDPHHKGLDLLIEACALASHRLRVARASIAVHGPSIAGSAQALQRLAHERGLDDLLRVKGPVYGEDKARAYAAVDLFLHTSRFEGHPMAVLEALSYGLPCLLTPGTNMADEVVAAGAGWRAEPTPQGIAGALVAAVEARQHLAAMGQRARQLVAERYTWGKVARALCEHYETIITSSPTGTAHKA